MKNGFGDFEWGNGSRYSGTFVDNRIEGKGTYEWSDGRKYTGDW